MIKLKSVIPLIFPNNIFLDSVADVSIEYDDFADLKRKLKSII